jgi:hypothetical protein
MPRRVSLADEAIDDLGAIRGWQFQQGPASPRDVA